MNKNENADRNGAPKAACCGGHDHAGQDHAGHSHHDHPAHTAATVRDPVCGMTVNPATSKHRFDYRGETFHFCSAGCRTKFAADPVSYLEKDSKPKAAVPEGTIYTCPMHPEIRQVGPGSCPICGMALEPEVASLDAPPNPELADMTRRFWIGLVLALPAVVLEMGGHLVGGHGLVDPTLSNWIQFAFATPVVLWAGWPFFVRGWQSLRHAQSQHVHADRDRHRRGLCLQRRRHRRAGNLPGDLPRPWRRGRRLFRSRRRHHRARAARPGA